MLRAVLFACVVVTAVLCSIVAAQTDPEAYRQPLQALLTDEAMPTTVALADRLREVSLGPEDAWPDEGVVAFGLTTRARREDGYAVINPRTQELVGFVAAAPQGPVPMDEMPPEQAQEVAEAFCARHLPELSAEGGEILVAVDETITPLGARMVHLQRTVEGVSVPTLADVGVRVYDGKVVYFHRKHAPLSPDVQLPGSVTLERAKEIAAGTVPGGQLDPILWFDCEHKVAVTPTGQRNVWVLYAEMKTTNTRLVERLEGVWHWEIDANSEQVVVREPVQITRDLYFRYVAAGGQHVPQNGRFPPDPLFEDSSPVFSPDGSRLAFLSTRPREGYPAWLARPNGLFVVNGDGSGLTCVASAAARNPSWSPDGSTVSYVADGKLYLRTLANGELRDLELPKGEQYTDAVWLDDQRLVAYRSLPGESRELALLELTESAPQPKALATRQGLSDAFGALAVTPDRTAVLATQYRFVTQEDKWDLVRVELTGEPAKPTAICDDPKAGNGMQFVGADKLFLWDAQPSPLGSQTWMLDIANCTAEPWKPPRPEVPDQPVRKLLEPAVVAFSPDGGRIAFADRMWDNDPTHAPATVLWSCTPDGADLKQVTPWEDALAPTIAP